MAPVSGKRKPAALKTKKQATTRPKREGMEVPDGFTVVSFKYDAKHPASDSSYPSHFTTLTKPLQLLDLPAHFPQRQVLLRGKYACGEAAYGALKMACAGGSEQQIQVFDAEHTNGLSALEIKRLHGRNGFVSLGMAKDALDEAAWLAWLPILYPILVRRRAAVDARFSNWLAQCHHNKVYIVHRVRPLPGSSGMVHGGYRATADGKIYGENLLGKAMMEVAATLAAPAKLAQPAKLAEPGKPANVAESTPATAFGATASVVSAGV
ncbi:MAG: hypothetical protein ACXVOI_09495 [Tumebacillaceae bacterium]